MTAQKKKCIVSPAMRVLVGYDEIIVPSARHFDYTARTLVNFIIQALVMKYAPVSEDEMRKTVLNSEQGFIDNSGQFHSPTAAWAIAFDAGQVKFRVGCDEHDGGTLYSENLY